MKSAKSLPKSMEAKRKMSNKNMANGKVKMGMKVVKKAMPKVKKVKKMVKKAKKSMMY